MPPIRPLLRPSIHNLANSLFSPTCRSSSHLNSHSLSHSIRRNYPSITPSAPLFAHRTFTTTRTPSSAPLTTDRGPPSQETTQTDFSSLDVLNNTPVPSTSIDACLHDGFHLNSGVKVVGSGVLLVGGEAFGWCPWVGGGKEKEGGSNEYGLEGNKWNEMKLVNEKGQFEVHDSAWGILGLVWPKPDLLILGLGKEMRPISPKTRQYLNGLGVRIEIQDTRNAAAQFNLLAMERGVGSVCAALIPLGWREGKGC